MKILYTILILFGVVTFTVCCDCQNRNWKWKHCGPEYQNALKLDLTAYYTEKCHHWALNGTSQHELGKIHSMSVEIEGTMGGIPAITFSDPKACIFKQAVPGEDEFSISRNILPIFCSHLETKNMDIVIPLNEGERDAISQAEGRFVDKVHFNNINNVKGLSDCYEFSGILQCEEEEEEEEY